MHVRKRLIHAFCALLVLSATLTLSIGAVATPPAFAAGLSDPGALTVHNGSMTVTTNGAVIENLEIRGTLRIEASNVVVRNVWVYTSSSWSIYVASGSATFDNIEVGHPSVWGQRGIGGSNVVVRNADIHHVEDGIKLGSNATYSGVRVHDLASPNSGPHADAVQVEGTAHNSVVKNSVLSSLGPVGLGNASVIVKSDLGSQSNITFANNYMNGGNYTIFVKNGGHGFPSNVSFVNNRFGNDRRYGLTSADGAIGWEGNTWADTGELIDQSGNVIGAGSGTTTTTTKAPAPTTTTTEAPATTTTEAADDGSTAASSGGADASVESTTTTVTSTTVAPTTTTPEDDVDDDDLAAAGFGDRPPTFGVRSPSTLAADASLLLLSAAAVVAVSLAVVSNRETGLSG